MSSASPSVIVVGAGPAGATLAYLLASRGIAVTLLERQHDFTRESRAEVLLPSGLEALQQMGLGDIFRGIPQVAPIAVELYANARPVFRLDVDPAFVAPTDPPPSPSPRFSRG